MHHIEILKKAQRALTEIKEVNLILNKDEQH